MLYPVTFQPIVKTRVWGGRRLETRYGRRLPPDTPIGESWEVSDRPGDESVIANGPWAGRSLHWLLEHHGADVLGDTKAAAGGRFPLLCKILDARETLSVQVHPPARVAAELGGEPKTEMWYIAEAAPDAAIFVGVRRGVTRAIFEAAIAAGRVDECLHRLPVRTGDTMFLPSGRVHAIGGGLVIFEIQQSSDTTYRVFDWNRTDAHGRGRDLHIVESLASIDFDDVEPALVDAPSVTTDGLTSRVLVRDPLFNVDWLGASDTAATRLQPSRMRIVAVVSGTLQAAGGGVSLDLVAGQFCLLPASLPDVTLRWAAGSGCLVVS